MAVEVFAAVFVLIAIAVLRALVIWSSVRGKKLSGGHVHQQPDQGMDEYEDHRAALMRDPTDPANPEYKGFLGR
ncbi:MAG: hypothetical protein AAFU49_00200 [Pseudomonadota bacterium]